MVATLNQQISKEYEVEQGRAQPWGAFVHLSGTSACLWLQHKSTFGVLPCVGWMGWGALVLVWGASLGWCFYSVCGFTFATWHCAVCALRQVAAGGCSSPRSSKQSPTIVRLAASCGVVARLCLPRGFYVVAPTPQPHHTTEQHKRR